MLAMVEAVVALPQPLAGQVRQAVEVVLDRWSHNKAERSWLQLLRSLDWLLRCKFHGKTIMGVWT